MEYLLVLTISGSTITAVYLLLRCLLKHKICARYFDLLARAAILYYLVPLPYLKKCYLVVLRRLLPESPVLISKISLSRRNHIVYAEDALHVNIYAGVQMVAAILWILAIGILLAVWMIEYVRLARIAARYADMAMTPECRAFLENLKKQYKIRRRVYLYEAMAGENTITFGFFKPVIICSRATTSPEAELLVRHELVHIKRMDVLWKMLMDLARMIHCYNPLVWILHSSFEQVCECSCDEIVMQERADVEVKEYLRLMIEEAREKEEKEVSLRWKSGFGDNTQKMKERMENLMRKKKWNRVAAVALVAALTFANSMTVFAYREPVERETTEEVSAEEIDRALESDTFVFVPGGVGGEVVQEFNSSGIHESVQEFLYDRQFVDEEGNIYPILENDGIEPHCDHTFVTGIGGDHIKTSGGGCIVTEFHAQRCSKCGYIIQGAEISRTIYKTCPH